MGHAVGGWVGQQTLVLLAGAPVLGVDEEQRRLGVMDDDVTDGQEGLEDRGQLSQSVAPRWSEPGTKTAALKTAGP